MTSSVARALGRYGGMLVAPRATVRGLGPDEGLRDGLWLGGLYLLATGTYELLEGAVTLRATANLNGLVMLLSAVVWALLAPMLVLVAGETVLGRDRAHRRGTLLVPLLVVVTLAHELVAHGLRLPAFAPEIVGGLLSVALAWWVRAEVEPQGGAA